MNVILGALDTAFKLYNGVDIYFCIISKISVSEGQNGRCVCCAQQHKYHHITSISIIWTVNATPNYIFGVLYVCLAQVSEYTFSLFCLCVHLKFIASLCSLCAFVVGVFFSEGRLEFYIEMQRCRCSQSAIILYFNGDLARAFSMRSA